MDDEQLMKKCLKLAQKGSGKTSPNPLVGAIIVKSGEIISAGYHKKFGLAHAEVNAINGANPNKIKGSTLYCNLEPCCHQGKTPPCTDLIIKSGIKKVVIGHKDPNPLVTGKGISKLKKAGIKVIHKILENECKYLNRHFIKFINSNIPYIHIKLAASLDGKIALKNGNSKWITNKAARSFSRKKRQQFDGILVGINTVLKDNPLLTVGKTNSVNDPKRIIIDPHFKINIHSKVLNDGNFMVITLKKYASAQQKKVMIIKEKKGKILEFTDINLKKILKQLKKNNINSILVEGGSYTVNSFLINNLVDEISYYISPIFLGNTSINAFNLDAAKNIPSAKKLQNVTYKKIGDNILINGLLLKKE